MFEGGELAWKLRTAVSRVGVYTAHADRAARSVSTDVTDQLDSAAFAAYSRAMV